MYDIFICEDVEVQLNDIRNILTDYIRCREINARIVCAEQDPSEILSRLENSSNFSVFFIDIQLKDYDMDGFALAGKIKEFNQDHVIVFLTSNEQIAYKVFEYGLEVLDYIVKKPQYFTKGMPDDELVKRLDAVFWKIGELEARAGRPSIMLTSGKRMIETALDDIIFIQSVKGAHFTEFYLYDRIITVRQTLKAVYEQLNEDFVFVNKSCVANMKKVKEFDKKERLLYMDGGFRVEAAYREIKRIGELLNK